LHHHVIEQEQDCLFEIDAVAHVLRHRAQGRVLPLVEGIRGASRAMLRCWRARSGSRVGFWLDSGDSGSIPAAAMANKQRTRKRAISAQPFDATDPQADDGEFLDD
jgi:hypothetical protein